MQRIFVQVGPFMLMAEFSIENRIATGGVYPVNYQDTEDGKITEWAYISTDGPDEVAPDSEEPKLKMLTFSLMRRGFWDSRVIFADDYEHDSDDMKVLAAAWPVIEAGVIREIVALNPGMDASTAEDDLNLPAIGIEISECPPKTDSTPYR